MRDIVADSNDSFLARPLRAPNTDAAVAFLRNGFKPREAWSSGLELELIGFDHASGQRITPSQVRSILERLCPDPARWERDGDDVIAVSISSGRITLEPGGQIEYSGTSRPTLDELEADLRGYLDELSAAGQSIGLEFFAVGFDPLSRLDQQRWIKKSRYDVMRPYLRAQGERAWDMMTRTASIQTSIDFSDDADLGKKFVLGNRLGPIVAAMFANSPFADGAATGRKSERYAAWLETDPDRSGVHSAALTPTFSLDNFVRRVFSTPLIFVSRNGGIEAGAGRTLYDLDDATISDFADALSTIFTEARIRPGYVEMRSADCGSLADTLAVIALWKGLTWDSAVLDAAIDLAPLLGAGEFVDLQRDIAARALDARSAGVDVLAIARAAGSLAVDGLARVAPDEARYLDPLLARLHDGIAPADIVLRENGGDVRRAMAQWRIGRL
ncbi:MAG TPA: glutamate-cysteine ligase family protein [Candidatus Eremiobacteraceae bacterium]|jgi:glutamate--cysteine ligase